MSTSKRLIQGLLGRIVHVRLIDLKLYLLEVIQWVAKEDEPNRDRKALSCFLPQVLSAMAHFSQHRT